MEARNHADSLIHSVEKNLEEFGEEVSEEEKTSINEAIKNLRESISADDPEPIKAKTEELAQISMKLGEAMYKKQQETNGAGNESAGESASANGNVGDSGGKAEEDENVIDAPFEELDDEDKKGKSS